MKKKTASRRRTTKVQKSEEKSYEITGVILFLFGLFILFSLFSDSTGFFGDITNKGSHFLFGFGAPFCALLMMFFGGRYAVTSKGISWDRRVALVILLVLLLFMAVHHFLVPFGKEMDIQSILTYGGIVGAGFCVFFHDAMGYWGTTLVLLGAIVIDVLLLTHWSLSRGAQKVGSKAQVIGKKTGEKIEAAAMRLREKKAALEAERSAARLEVLDDKPTEFIYKRNEDHTDLVPDEESSSDEEAAIPAQVPDVEGASVSPAEEAAEPQAEEMIQEPQEEWKAAWEDPEKEIEEPQIPPLPSPEEERGQEPDEIEEEVAGKESLPASAENLPVPVSIDCSSSASCGNRAGVSVSSSLASSCGDGCGEGRVRCRTEGSTHRVDACLLRSSGEGGPLQCRADGDALRTQTGNGRAREQDRRTFE